MPGIAALEPCASIMFSMTFAVIQHRCWEKVLDASM